MQKAERRCSGQQEVWRKSIEVFEDGRSAPRTVALFAEDRRAPVDDEQVIQVRLKDLAVRNARHWGACWLACELYEQLNLNQFWVERLPPSRKGTRWDLILETLCIYRLIEPGSEWRLHRHWFDRSAVADLLGSDFRLAESHRLYDCHDLLLKHKEALFYSPERALDRSLQREVRRSTLRACLKSRMRGHVIVGVMTFSTDVDKLYDTDLTDAAWALIAPLLPAARPGGRPRKINIRAVLTAIFYLLRTGCQWRLLPREFPRLPCCSVA